MRKFIAVFAAGAMALSLGACATNPATGVVGIDQTQLANVEAQIQQTAANVCQFVPTVASVAGVIAGFVSGGAVVDLVNQAAQSICSAVASAPTVKATVGHRTVQRLASPVTVNGVAITGHFIKK